MCRVRRVGVCLLVAVVLVGLIGAIPTAATGNQSATPGTAQLGDAGIEPDGVLLRADLRADGDARFTVEYRVRLNDENTTVAFESLRDDIEANDSAYTSTFADRMRATTRAAENATGREMRVQSVSVRATRQQLPQEYGVVTYGFEWTGFAAVGENTLEAGDALAGLFLDRQTTFVVAWPDEYATTNVQPAPDERRDDAVVWVGPTDFGDGEPVVSLSTTAPESTVGGSESERTGGDGDGGGDAEDEPGGTPSTLAVVGGGLLFVIGVAAVVLWRRSESSAETAIAPDVMTESDAGRSAADETASVGAAATEDSGNGTGNTGGDTGDTSGTSDTSGTGGTSNTGGTDNTNTETSEASTANDEDEEESVAPWADELLSNEERVLALLEHNDGRMKQQAVAAELDWSDAKTSQVIGKLRDAEELETFRLGRENVVALPGSGLS